MKVRLIALLGICICIAILIVSGPDAQGKKPVKPEETQSEWITFTGDLVGAQEVEGPWGPDEYPAYTIQSKFLSDYWDYPEDTYYDGHLWINHGHGTMRKKYIVHFWTDEFGIEIIGGVIDYDRETEVLKVTFTDEMCLMCENMELDPDTDVPTGECIGPWITFFDVNFILEREPY